MRLAIDRRSETVLRDSRAVAQHHSAVFDLRARRDAAIADLPDFEALRRHAAAIKDHTLDHLDRYLESFVAEAQRRGATVHTASDAREHNAIVLRLLREHSVKRVVKSKSMLTEECGLTGALERAGYEVVETDLGERIAQLGRERPSHIVIPVVHRSRQEIGALFHRHLAAPAGETDPARLTRYARRDLRSRFLAADAGITGVNFAIAETGSLVICTNEGNADLGMAIPRLHIASLGIEKLIPRLEDLPVFLRLLARSATGQPITAYTTLVTGPRAGGELHLILVDNGRSALAADPLRRPILRCIRCGACLNTCPVYRRAGGHAYGTPVPGPLGAVLASRPGSRERSLAFASSLCGSCSEVCPVAIDLHGILRRVRQPTALLPFPGRWALALAAWLLERPRLYRALARGLRRLGAPLRAALGRMALRGWQRDRELPPLAPKSFAEIAAEEEDRP